ncbi:MAG TPA: hypothetical protein VLH10_15255, partial [Yinghuangia sp.]|nr:hypothetical protein [Yinghuangia sp.]
NSTSDGGPVAGRVELVGTAAYTAPERALGHPPRPAADLYSLGCVLYEALTGQPPFAGDAPTSVLHRHVRELPTPLGQLRPDVPKEFATLVDRLLAKNPHDRPDSAAATAAMLAGIAGTAPAGQAAGADPGATQLLPPVPSAAADDPPTALLQPATEDEHVPHSDGRRDRRGLMLAAGLVGALLAVGLVIGLLVAIDTGGGSEAPEAKATTGAPTLPGPSLPASPGTATASEAAAPSAAASPTTASPTPTTSAPTSAPATTTPPVTPQADLAADLSAAYTTASAGMQPNLARSTRSDVNEIVANLRSGEEDKAAARARDLRGRLVEAQQKGRWDGDAAFLQLLGRIAAG